MIGLCQICGKRPARIYDDDLELRMCGECRASYKHGDELGEDPPEDDRRARRREIALMASTAAFGGFVVVFVAEPSTTSGMCIVGSMLVYAVIASWVALTDRARCTKRYG